MTHAAQSLPPETPAYVITVSDSVSAGVNSDRSGPLAVEMLSELGFVLSGPMVAVSYTHLTLPTICSV